MVDKIDWNATYMNALTSGVLRSARMPIVLENDRVALEAALNCSPDPQKVRLARIVNTGSLETFWATEVVMSELREQQNISVDNKPIQPEFTDDGRLRPMAI